MSTYRIDRSTFVIERDCLVRSVAPKRGGPYEHRCPRGSYEAIAHAIDEQGDAEWVGENIVVATDLPSSQVYTALAFLYERSIIDRDGRLNHAVTPGNVHLDAMIEWHALAAKGDA